MQAWNRVGFKWLVISGRASRREPGIHFAAGMLGEMDSGLDALGRASRGPSHRPGMTEPVNRADKSDRSDIPDFWAGRPYILWSSPRLKRSARLIPCASRPN